jgi:poly(3-hydroxybutyrate) depolymerase
VTSRFLPAVMRSTAVAAAAVAAIGLGAATAQDRAVDVPGDVARLPSLSIDPGGISVSGVSAGGYMATQLHIAHSRRIMGAGVLAAGPYHCAGGGYPFTMVRSLSVCSDYVTWLPFFGPPDPERAIAEINRQAGRDAIDDPSHLTGDRVYLFSGTQDEQVPQSVVAALNRFYDAYLEPEDIAYIDTVPSAHAMVTDGFGNACDVYAPPYISDCTYDAAGELLAHIYGPLEPPVEASAEPGGTLLEFDQSEFFGTDERASMDSTAQVYIPRSCADGATCRLHVAFHGCRQFQENIGDAFYANAGYNSWAEANDIIVLYPQTVAYERTFLGVQLAWPNPLGCWDWWGYTGNDFHLKSGTQIRAVAAMIDRLTGQ